MVKILLSCVMSMLSDLLNKAPQSIKDKYKIKIRDKAIEKVKEKIVKHNKTIDDDTSEGEIRMVRMGPRKF